VFGPTGEENYTKTLSVSAKRQALRQALSLAASENRIKVVEAVESKDGKVAPFVALLSKLEATGNILLAVDVKDAMIERATRNLPQVKTVQANYLNVHDILNSDTVVLSQKSLDIINQWLAPKKAESAAKAAPKSKGGAK
jgi:large subunit ribosomal protein L4